MRKTVLKMVSIITLLLVFSTLMHCSISEENSPLDNDAEKYSVQTDTVWLPLPDQHIAFVRHHAEKPGLLLVNLHDDENTSVEAAGMFIQEFGGTVFELKHSGERNISFEKGGRSFQFDPNRIFTRNGVRATLERFGENIPGDAVDAVSVFADSLLATLNLQNAEIMVAIHNNTENSYSAGSYGPGGAFAADAASVIFGSGEDPDDFLFVTDPSFFDHFGALGFNVVLQNNESVTDDGSLSVLCGYLGVPYINIEAQHGHVEKQISMLEQVHSLIFD